MDLQFKRNIHFTRLIKANNRLREFNFRKTASFAEPIYHLDVSDDRGNRIMFKMQQEENVWRIMDPSVPKWISALETELHDLIIAEDE